MSYLVIAYPELKPEDLQLMQACRKDHDELYPVVAPHFTIVFAIDNVPEQSFVPEVVRQLTGVKKISFSIRSAIVNKDAFSDHFHTFLVPDEGFSSLVKLHDKLYSGLFSDNLRPDISYIPHISIARSPDRFLCKKIADEWNNKNFVAKGEVNTLSIVRYAGGKIMLLEEIVLE